MKRLDKIINRVKKFSIRKGILPPNVLLTNFCNQNCPYCFAKDEMERATVKEMSLEDFKKLVVILKKNKIRTLRLMGGEPTLHSYFDEIIKLALAEFEEILIFTNGLIPTKSRRILEKNLNKISFNFNLNTPAFEENPAKRKEIITLIKKYSQNNQTNIGFTLTDLRKDYSKLAQGLKPKILKKIGIRFGLAKAIMGEKPFFNKEDNKKLSKKIVDLVKFFKKLGIKEIFLDCGLEKKIFNVSQRNYLLKNTYLKGWGCEGKWGSFDITPDLLLFTCFPFYKKKVPIKKIKNFCDFQKFFPKQNCFKE